MPLNYLDFDYSEDADGNGTLAIVQDDLPRDEAGLRRFLAAATNLEVDPAAP